MHWTDMTPQQRSLTLPAMHRFGGRFVKNLAYAWDLADTANAEKLAAAFPDLVAKYGPQSGFFAEVAITGVGVRA